MIAIITLYLVLVALVFLFQRKLMYHPRKAIGAPASYGLDMQETFIPSMDNVQLQLWYAPARSGYPTIIYFHGNSDNLGWRAPIFRDFTESGFGLVASGYRGFGKSSGHPTEQGIYQDARATIEYALRTLHIHPEKLVYYGESLGTGVAVQMATEQKPALLVLQAAYTSVATRSAELYPFIPGARFLVRDHYDSLRKIALVHCPLLMLHGEKDRVIPVRHAEALFDAANEPRKLITYREVSHISFTTDQIISPLLAEAQKYGLVD